VLIGQGYAAEETARGMILESVAGSKEDMAFKLDYKFVQTRETIDC
jgi:hypothetical protein